MEEMSPAVAVTLSLGNSVCDKSGIATHVEFTRLKLLTDTGNVPLDSSKLVSSESVSCGNGSINEAISAVRIVTMSAQENNGGGADLFTMLPGNGNSCVANDAIVQVREEDDVLLVEADSNGITNEELLALSVDSGISLPDVMKIENVGDGQIVGKPIILVESSAGQVPSGEVNVAAVSPVSEISDKSELMSSTVVFQSHREKNVGKGGRSVFELDCIPLWGSVSICGRRPEMEDAIATIPRFMKIPIRMLIGNHMSNGISESLTHLTSHFFGVYDGHGGSQVHRFSQMFICFIQVRDLTPQVL